MSDANISYAPTDGLSYDPTDPVYWDEAAMALFKLYVIEDGERFTDLELPQSDGEEDLTVRAA